MRIPSPTMESSRFTWEKYCGKVGIAITQILKVDSGFQTVGIKPGVTILGICDAANVPVRQRPGEWAIMVECAEFEHDNVCWFHADEYTMRGLGFEV